MSKNFEVHKQHACRNNIIKFFWLRSVLKTLVRKYEKVFSKNIVFNILET